MLYQEQVAFGVELGGGEFLGHGVWDFKANIWVAGSFTT